ncbi:MAG: major facilitator superfamily transporter [Actinomycetia bacterium]|nr:major facilitator superfamily transporter [Actinomycetes bacterium]
MVSSRTALLGALGVDNAGSGLFLPVALLYVTRDVGLPLTVAGTVVAAGTVAGLAVPPLAGHLGDRVGPRRVVVAAELLQVLGAVTYLAARGVAAVAAAAVLLAAGQQLFYSTLFALISDVAGDGPKDRPFAVAAMVRSACFGAGGLAAAGLLSLAGPAAYRIAVAVDAGSFAVCALLLALLVRTPGPPRRAAAAGAPARLRSDRPFLALIVITGLVALPVDFFLSGISVYLLEELRAPPWLPGAVLAVATGLNSAGATAALWFTRRLRRTTAMGLGAALYVAWCAAGLAALAVPAGWRPAEMLAATVVMAAAGLLFQARVNALAEAVAPAAARGRYLAAFQYAFTVPGVLAPAVVALFPVAVWLPWVLVGTAAGLAVLGLRVLAGHLPAAALRPGPHVVAEAAAVRG